MTEQELKRAYYIRQEIKAYEQKLRTLRSRSLIGGGRMDGMPRQTSAGDRVSQAAIAAADLEQTLIRLQGRLIQTEAEIMRYIAGVEDALVRRLLYMRYLECRSWASVARRLGGGNTPDGCRMMVKRWLEKDHVRNVRPDRGKV